MQKQLQIRLEALKREFESGEKLLADLKVRRANLEQTLLRISGAIQVLAELLAADTGAVDWGGAHGWLYTPRQSDRC